MCLRHIAFEPLQPPCSVIELAGPRTESAGAQSLHLIVDERLGGIADPKVAEGGVKRSRTQAPHGIGSQGAASTTGRVHDHRAVEQVVLGGVFHQPVDIVHQAADESVPVEQQNRLAFGYV